MSTFLVLALATYRLSILIAQDDGPYDVCWRLRDAVKRRYTRQDVTIAQDYQYRGYRPAPDAQYGTTDSWQYRGVSCPLCLSFWFGIVIAVCYVLAPSVTLLGCLPLALSGVTVAIVSIGDKS